MTRFHISRRLLLSGIAAAALTTGVARAQDLAPAAAEAKALLEAQLGTPAFWAPPAFDIALAKGKQVWWITDQKTNILKQWSEGGQEAAGVAGLDFHLFDAGSSVPEQVRGIDLAVSSGAAAVVIGTGFPGEAFAPQIAAAKAAGIPVFTINSHPLGPDAPPRVDGHVADVSYNYPGAGKLLADWFVADSNDAGHVLLVDISGLPSAGWTLEGFKAEVARLKSNVKIDEAATGLGPSIQTDLANLASTTILRDPSITYIIPPFDDFALFVQQGLAQSGASGKDVKTAGFNAVLTQVTNLKNGGTQLQIDLGGPNQWFSYAVIDDVLRSLTGQEVIQDYKIGYKVFTHDNTQAIDTTKEVDSDWYGVDYSAEFKKVWGLN